jgi:tetratricopeptide (TPR) repeat protein
LVQVTGTAILQGFGYSSGKIRAQNISKTWRKFAGARMTGFRGSSYWQLRLAVFLLVLPIIPVECFAQSNLQVPTVAFGCSNSSVAVTSVHELRIPEKALAACNKGTQHFVAKDSAGSIPEFQKAIKAFPGYYEAYAELGAAELDLEHWDQAEAAFRQSIDLSGGRYAPADFGLGLILATVKKQFVDAETVIRNGLEVVPNDTTGNFVLAWVMYSTTRLQEAEKSAREAVLSSPKFGGARLLLAQIHLAEKNLAAAVQDMDAYLSFGIDSPLNAKVQEARAEALRSLSADGERIATAKANPDPLGRADMK